jgi:hypothetical protein
MITIHQSQYYAAHLMTQGLIVESTRKTGGVILRHDHAQFAEYVDALRTAIDSQESDALCKALLN